MRHVIDRQGVLFAVQYDRDSNGVVEFKSVRALDGEYRETGPDLLAVFHGHFEIKEDEDGTPSGHPILNGVIHELP